jgi:hypothetical protein
MIYRTSSPEDSECIDEADELAEMQDYVQNLMDTTKPHDMLDALLMMVNICDARSLGQPKTSTTQWYQKTSISVRTVLEVLATKDIAPNSKLENPGLYYPIQEQQH